MIEPPVGWSIETRFESVLLMPPKGPAQGGIRYRDRLRPLAPFPALAREHLAQPGFVLDRMGPFERFVTREGEHGLHVTAHGQQGKRRVQRDLAFILLDDAYARLSGIARDEADFATFSRLVREAAIADRHHLGVRRRWFEYVPPPGWRSRPRGFSTEWTPPAFPRERALLVVWPALPRSDAGDAEGAFAGVFGTQGADVVTVDDVPIVATGSAAGLTGYARHLVRRSPEAVEVHTHAAVLVDDRYVYPLRLELSEAQQRDHGSLLHQVVRTIVPVPRAHVASGQVPVGVWTE